MKIAIAQTITVFIEMSHNYTTSQEAALKQAAQTILQSAADAAFEEAKLVPGAKVEVES